LPGASIIKNRYNFNALNLRFSIRTPACWWQVGFLLRGVLDSRRFECDNQAADFIVRLASDSRRIDCSYFIGFPSGRPLPNFDWMREESIFYVVVMLSFTYSASCEYVWETE
jgi:hypothetical protein